MFSEMTHGRGFVKNPVEFVRASKRNFVEIDSNEEINFERNDANVGFSSEEAKGFYENLLKSTSFKKANEDTSRSKSKLSQKRTRIKADIKPSKSTLNEVSSAKVSEKSTYLPKVVDFFKAAEEGQLLEVQKIVETRLIDIDAADQFSWTALMMAAHQGHANVVKYLLIQGADWENKFDGSGYDAYDLACLSGHDRIAHMLKYRKSIIKTDAVQTALALARKRVKRERLWCEICKIHYDAAVEKTEMKHESSITHQFCSLRNDDSQPQTSFYLDASNKGYKLLKTHGWDGASGLGPSSSGRKYPIKTVLKRDRAGFGCATDPARVTHFASQDSDAVKRVKITKQKNLRKRKDERLKNLEIDFRRSFH